MKLDTPHYSGAVVDFLDRESGQIKRMMMYPITRIELQEWNGNGWATQQIFQPVGEGSPTSALPVRWTQGNSK